MYLDVMKHKHTKKAQLMLSFVPNTVGETRLERNLNSNLNLIHL